RVDERGLGHRARRGLPAVEGTDGAAARVVEDKESTAADTGRERLGDAERGGRRDGRVDRLATVAKHLRADLRGVRVDRGDRATEADGDRRLLRRRRGHRAFGSGDDRRGDEGNQGERTSKHRCLPRSAYVLPTGPRPTRQALWHH